MLLKKKKKKRMYFLNHKFAHPYLSEKQFLNVIRIVNSLKVLKKKKQLNSYVNLLPTTSKNKFNFILSIIYI